MQHDQFQLHADIEDRHWWFVGRRRILGRLTEELLPPSPEALVVDVGCGTGGNLSALAARYRCIGIDTSPDAIKLARQRVGGADIPVCHEDAAAYGRQESLPHQIEFIVGRAPGGLGALARQARLVMLADVLEHVEDDRGMFAELVAATSPGCYFLLTVPADPSLWSQHDESFGHCRRYDAAGLAAVWAGLPIAPLLLSYFNSRLLPVVRLVRAWNRRRGRASGRAGTDFWLPNPMVNALLTRTLAGEARRLVAALRKGINLSGGADTPVCHLPEASLKPPLSSGAYRAGSSLVAVLRRCSFTQ